MSPSPGQTYLVDSRGEQELHQFDTAFRPSGIARWAGGTELDTTYRYEDAGSCSGGANNGNLCAITDPLGRVTSFTYDSRGNVLSVANARRDGTCPSGCVTSYTYTSLNDVKTLTDGRRDTTCPSGCTTTYKCDNELPLPTECAASGPGKLCAITNARSETTTFAYGDPVYNPGLVTRIIDALGDSSDSTYDPYGNRVTSADMLGDTVSYQYQLSGYADGVSGRVSAVIDARRDTTCPSGCVTKFTYDAMNRIIGIEDPVNGSSAKTQYTYDATGNRLTQQNVRGLVTDYAYDAKNRLRSVTQPLVTIPTTESSRRKTTYTYDRNDNLISVRDPRRQSGANAIFYNYDELNRLVKVRFPDRHYVTDFRYNGDGTRASMTDTMGACEAVTPPGCLAGATETATSSYTYDAVQNLASSQLTFVE
ncbi:MAG: RHS repeat protein [Chloroflexi bacterium]|nr:RHS repeat protein [Chloroflexota bacterium]